MSIDGGHTHSSIPIALGRITEANNPSLEASNPSPMQTDCELIDVSLVAVSVLKTAEMVEDGGGEIVLELDIGVTTDSENDVNVVVGCVMVVTGNVVVKIIEPLPPISVGPEGSGAEMLEEKLGLGLGLGLGL